MTMNTDKSHLIQSIALVNPIASEFIGATKDKQTGQNHRYDYTDAVGKVLFTKQRYAKKDGSKTYAFSHVTNEDLIVNTMPQFADGTPLYNLHLFSKYPTSTVYFVEGEKCVEALTKLKLLATTSGGASSDDKADFTPLARRNVIMWPDNDAAGIGYMQRVTQKLLALNNSVRQLNIDALELPVKGDVCDWLGAFALINERDATAADIEGLTLKSEVMLSPAIDLKHGVDRSLSTNNDDATIQRLASLKTIEYERVRDAEAKSLGVRTSALDKLVKEAKSERQPKSDSTVLFDDIEPWHEPINPSQLLTDITDTIKQFIAMDHHQAQVAALWVSASWFIDVVNTAPFALINAPEKACGKTQLLTVLSKLANKPLQSANMSASTLYRVVEAHQPTLFIDEVETFLRDNEELRGILNAGHTRDSAYVMRCVGDDHDVHKFSVWAFKAIAGINAVKLAETITSRSVVFELRKKLANEKVTRLRYAQSHLFADLQSNLARFRDDYSDRVKYARPHLPDWLGDREQDNFEPLLQVATVAGDQWLQCALQAIQLMVAQTQTPNNANELLADIQEVFDVKSVIKITSTELITALCDDPEKSWLTYNRGKQLTPRQLSSKLKNYGITSKQMRFNTYENASRGYELTQFTDVFERYLTDPLNLPLHVTKSLEANTGLNLAVTDNNFVTLQEIVPLHVEQAKARISEGVTDVTDKIHVYDNNAEAF